MTVVPRKMWRALDLARLQAEEDDKRVNQPDVICLLAALLVHLEVDALQFCIDLCRFAINNFYTLVNLRCGNWQITRYAVSRTVSERTRSVSPVCTFYLVYHDGVEREGSVSRSVSVYTDLNV